MKDQQNITIKIADVAPISMTISRDSEQWVREAERGVNRVWQTWRSEFQDKSSKEVLAMTAYQFAKLYFQLLHNVEKRQATVDNFEKELNRLLQLTDEIDAASGRKAEATEAKA